MSLPTPNRPSPPGSPRTLLGEARALVPLLLAVVLPVLAVLFLAWAPFDRYWILGYEGLHFYRIWPWLVLAAAACMPLVGVLLHARHGRPLHLPRAAGVAALAMLVVSARLATSWSLEWHAALVWLSCLPLAAMSLAIVAGFVAFSEVWRRFCNGAVVDAVTRRIGLGILPALRIVPENSRYARQRPWGSPHRLATLTAYYRLNLARLYFADYLGQSRDVELRRLLRAGGALFGCLLRRWPDQAPDQPEVVGLPGPQEREARTASVLMDMVALGLDRLRTPDGTTQELEKELRETLPLWLEALQVVMGPQAPGLALVRLLVEAGVDGSACTRTRVAEIVDLARSLPRNPAGDGGPQQLSAYCAALWLVVAAEAPRAELIHDVWRELFGRIPSPEEAATDAAPSAWRLLEVQHLIGLLDRRLEALPSTQRSGLELQRGPLERTAAAYHARIEALLQQHGNPQDLSQIRPETSADVPSWPYWEVRRAGAVRILVGGMAAVALALPLLLLFLSNPYVSILGANSVDHVQDPRWYASALSGDCTDMAHSDYWLALANGQRGLTLFNTRSRLPREGTLKSPVVDVASGIKPGSFLAVTEEQGVEEVIPGVGLLGTGVETRTWIEPPKNWGWPGPGQFAPETILANTLDERGWLLAVRGRGIARYQFLANQGAGRTRARSWQVGSAAMADLEQVAPTHDGLWFSERGGGLSYADGESLDVVANRKVATPRIRRLDANYNEAWASATDALDGLWLFAAGGSGWSGAYFGHVDPKAPKLASLDAVRVARLQEDRAWLGSDQGVFSYDRVGRRLQPLLPNFAATELEPDATAGASLAAGRKGLYVVPTSGKPRQLETQPVSSLALSEDGSVGAWMLQGRTLRVARTPFQAGKPQTWIPDAKGPRIPGTPTVLDARRVDDGLLLLTRNGAVYYEGATHTYRDASRTRVPAVPGRGLAQKTETLRSIDDVDETAGRIAILADGRPHLLQAGSPAGTPLWAALDPARQGRPVAVAQASGQVFGLGADGRLLSYKEAGVTSHPPTPGGLPAQGSPSFRTTGDLWSREDSTWLAAFIHEGLLRTYDSKSGATRTSTLTPEVRDRVSQVRLAGEVPYLLADGRVYSASGKTLLGFANLPFNPGQATALSPGTEAQSALVGGPEGRLLQYRWDKAAWSPVGGGPVPGARGAVDEAIPVKGGAVARVAGQVFRGTARGWSPIADCRRAAFPSANQAGWGLFPNSVRRLRADTLRVEGPAYCAGMADPQPAGGWRAAWQPAKDKLVLFSDRGDYAAWNSATDSWSSAKLPGRWDLRLFTPWQSGMMVMQGRQLYRITPGTDSGSYRIRLFATAPAGSTSLSLTSAGSNLLLAYTYQGASVLNEWTDLRKKHTVYYRGGSTTPEGFDPAQVVVAAAAGRGALLFDAAGGCAAYDPLLGRWTRERRPVPGQKVYAWISAPRPAVMLQTAKGGTVTLRVLPEGWLSERTYDATPQQVLARLEWEGSKWAAPGEGTLLQARRLKVTRSQGRTSYQAGRGQSWLPLRLTARGFAEDYATSLAATPSGQVWAVANGRLLQQTPENSSTGLPWTGQTSSVETQSVAQLPNGDLRTRGPAGAATWSESQGQLRAVREVSPKKLASLTMSGRVVDWNQVEDGQDFVVGPRRQDGKAVAFDRSGRLDFQVVRDLTAQNGQLLLATPDGVVVRNAESFELVGIQDAASPVALVRAFGPDRVLVRLEDGRVVALEEKGVGSADLRGTDGESSRVTTGGVVWSLATSKPGLALTSGKAKVSWHPFEGGFRPDSDRVTRLDRDAATAGALVLRTPAGSWRFDQKNLRGSEPAPQPDPAGQAPTRVENPALQVECQTPALTFTSSDNRPVFAKERFYFDSGRDLVGSGDTLYALVEGRGVVARSAGDLPKITGFWALDPAMPEGRAALSEKGGRLVLTFPSGSPTSRIRWFLDPNKPGSRWEKDPNQARPERVEYGPIAWEGWRDGRSGFKPMATVDGRQVPLTRWWNGDRFTWDAPAGVGTLGTGTIVAVTPAGLVCWSGSTASFLECRILPQEGLTTVVPAWREGRRAGLLAAGPGGRFQVTGQGADSLKLTADQGLQHHPRLELAFNAAVPQAHLELTQRFDDGDPTRSGGSAALRSALPGLSPAEVLVDGQFVFDRGEAACPVAGNPDTWAVYAPATGRNRITLNTVSQKAADGRSRLQVTALLEAPTSLRRMRSFEGGFLAEDSQGRWWAARVQDRQITWTPRGSVNDVEALRTGDRVVLDVASLVWSATPRHLGDTGMPLEVTPSDYPLFATMGKNTVLAFDGLTSISAHPKTRTVAVGTLGGVFTAPIGERGESLLTLEAPGAQFDCRWTEPGQSPTSSAYNLLTDVREVQHDLKGNLFARMGQSKRVARLDIDGSWTGAGGMPQDENRTPQHQVAVVDGRLVVDGQTISNSNDLLSSRRPLTEIVGKAYDAEDNSLWLATRNEGLFKVVLRALLD